ncbi:MAG: rod shape-determining protein MreC [Desulfuromonadaceae bacterium GWC2_58_13]|nr:MAG: rod shape-determining protein MreC [Desulfuromonadaceae bacterium GWC2_58_13]
MLDLLRKYRTALLAVTLVLAALLLYSQNLRQGEERTNLFEKLVLRVTAPLQIGVMTVCETFSDWLGHYLWLVDTRKENDRLLEENRHLAAELSRLREVRLTNERLQKLLDFREQQALSALPAQVVTEDATSWFRTVMIDKGRDDGVREGMPVVVAEGVAGRIIRVAARQSRVLLITDASSAIATLVQRNRTRGVCRGRGDTLNFDFALREKDIEVGDLIITSGNGGVFPKGLPVGTVVRVEREEYGLFQVVEVMPTVDFSRLEEVLVLLKEEP